MISTAILAFVPTPLMDEASWSPLRNESNYIQEVQSSHSEASQQTETSSPQEEEEEEEEEVDYSVDTSYVEQADPIVEVQTSSVATGNDVVSRALSFQGAPYLWGGKTPAGWDCSGFVSYLYPQAAGNTAGIRASANTVQVSDPQPGDLVFQNGGSHVGIYLGEDLMISARNPSMGTTTHPIHGFNGGPSGYYRVVG